ncbi:MAG: DUF6178 family protein [Desulfarculaceae bacterium]|nr:DUF6178 family protein [Desulfarculaceae bacterium]MCF8070936.1 DUF6178 family protein [Desulfarculaceae bacterium]MCF8100524.1 DUF6178 family protein [Desulfarculaceae bacterium]MCF8116550.1 DUF6178 family protein [Desulfarculaceae bacterium]
MNEISKSDLIAKPGEILDIEKRDPRQAEALWHGLSEEERLRAVLNTRGLEREKLIILAQDSAALTQALPVDEFASTVLEVGPGDAGALIELCDDEQLAYLLDLTGWWRESFDPARYQVWLPLIMDAGTERLKRWLAAADMEVLALLLNSWIKVVKFLPSQEQQEPPDDLPEFTLDGLYFIEFINPKTKGFVAQILVLIKSEAPETYANVLEAVLWEGLTELDEYATRWRNGRMADHGFPSRLEALELWAEPAPGEADWDKLQPKAAGAKQPGAPRADRMAGLLPESEFLPVVAGGLGGEATDMFRSEVAYIASCGVAALEADPASPEEVARAAKESLGLVNLGLGVLSQGDEAKAGEIVARLGLAALARQGAMAIRRLNKRAWELTSEGWLSKTPTGLHLLEPPLDRWLAGLLYSRPRCYDPTLDQGREYRAFLGLADVEAAGDALDQAEFWGVLLLELMGIEPEEIKSLIEEAAHPADPTEIKLSHVIGTWLARREMDLDGLAPIPAERLNEAVVALQKGLAGELEAELADSLQALPDPAQAALAGRALRGLLTRLEQELGGLKPSAEIDPRFVAGLVVGP